MEYGKLGNTDIEVSKLCVGCMSFGKAGTMHDWTLDEAESENVIKHALDLGYNFFDTANGYWQWKTYHEANIDRVVKDESALIVENVRIKEFVSLQEFAKYRGVNNVLSRGFNGMEKAGNAALATQHEFYQKIWHGIRGDSHLFLCSGICCFYYTFYFYNQQTNQLCSRTSVQSHVGNK